MSIKNSYTVIGLMSGTSLDGLDIACCFFEFKNNKWHYEILNQKSIDYDPKFKQKLKKTTTIDAASLFVFHNEYGTWLGEQVKLFCTQNKIKNIDFIASHGHTVFHQPEIGLTYQIGSGQHLANASNLKVICDFRTNDVALGGQGAPLVPIGDSLLFNEYDFCLNLGGISNISFDQAETRIAYDICPVNMLLNHICNKINKAYDTGGEISKKGTLNTELLKSLNNLDYYTQDHPKSLGIEWFSKNVLSLIDESSDTIENLLHTSVHHIAQQITKEVNKAKIKNGQLLITGGGAKNDFLIKILREALGSSTTVIKPSDQLIDYKEALLFAFMGVLKDRNEMNCLRSVTGASKNSSSGIYYTPG